MGQTPEMRKGRELRVDSLKHIDNPRWWYPGEPITWAPDGVLDSLFAMELDGFLVFTESPRSKNYNKAIAFSRSPEGREALFIQGDCRYISYDRGRTNSSHSIVNGHNHYSSSYWKEGTLYFQSGHANWFRHTQRLYHSQETLQMERYKTEDAPERLEIAAVLPLQDGCAFLYPMSETMTRSEVVPAYFLAHNSTEFEWWGRVNPAVGNVNNELTMYPLQDYSVIRNGSSLTVIRRSDLSFVNVPSKLASRIEANTGSIRGTCSGWKGNVIFREFPDGEAVIEDLDSLVIGAAWSPLILPAQAPTKQEDQQLDSTWGWTLAVIMTSAFLLLLFDRLTYRGRIRFVPIDPSAGGTKPIAFSQWTETMLAHSGHRMGSDAFDQIIGLGQVESPETRRSKRSRYIQLVNAEAQARFGRDLVVRVRSEEDKRVMLYHIIRLDEDHD
jgi:hypothetical protein